MRLPLIAELDSRDGTSNKNARLTNCLKEVGTTGELATVRPGLSLDVQASGVGNGLVSFNNTLVSVYGSTLGEVVQSGTGSYGSWTRVTGVLPSGSLVSASYGNGNFIATNGTTFYRSPGGISWEAVGSPGADQWSLCSDGTNFIAVGVDGCGIYRSIDNGETWTLHYTMPVVAPLASEATTHFDGSYFFVSVEDGNGDIYFLRSSDGALWSISGSGISATSAVQSFASGGGSTVACCTLGGGFITSDHGATWSNVPTLSAITPQWIAYGFGMFIAIDSSTGAYGSATGSVFSSLGAVPLVNNYGITFDGENFIITETPTGNYTLTKDGVSWVSVTDTSGTSYAYRPVSGNGVTVASAVTTNEILALNGFGTVINTLGTVQNQRFDFAQSPL